ncbi:MAG: VOC family protein [Ignavibacteriaceae bacterium]|jgi:Glyoxalase/Bleomycin resistance protein/Dioxygenase superfamily.|nr:MAG: hypothetical protein EDM69_04210 [Chlorobiota bacterium]KXK04974.1 MAG: Glyoxalase/Bleomycin resistance protein/Dioxygenase superfamily protein [Chlorobi bacterium OLB4]MBV6397787.1 hypothetical protein [Ignavibacteria bacterium]MCC6885564.1 VOC family protein [Ignavibacteriales bacterium]MCE7952918.1 hypothetical protein [Chlorobi bacterium CHB7]MDL1886918.1 hypothetical protein [Ignavibacteria bacterium CHB1]MEB2328688.1 VOC family protein [Ignavibacteriaceae bacterium]OQY78592.1 M
MKFEFSPHIAIKVRKYDDAIKFYKEVLGMEIVNRKDFETHFKKDGINFYIENDEKMPGVTFFEFKVDDVKETLKLMEENGCVLTQVYSNKSIMMADPFGIKYHLWEK